MLVFTRKLDQAIVVGDGVEIRIMRIGRDSVRIGVTAAPEVPVHRLEIYEEIRVANALAVAAPGQAHELVSRLQTQRTALTPPHED
ncbi:MAG: carbon storage regulator [Vicinamibacterales bacterium]